MSRIIVCVTVPSIEESYDISIDSEMKINDLVGLLRKVIETYRERAKADRKVSVALIRATSLIAARMHVKTLLPLIQETYKKLRISSKGCGAISKVEQIMDDE